MIEFGGLYGSCIEVLPSAIMMERSLWMVMKEGGTVCRVQGTPGS